MPGPIDLSNFTKNSIEGAGGSVTKSGVIATGVLATDLGGSSAGTSAAYASVATGVAATDTAALATAITATPPGGTLYIDGHYKINATLTFPQSIILRGRQKTTYSGLSALPSGPNSMSQITGSIIEQTTAGIDAVAVTVTGGTFHASDVWIGFTAALASTGHGWNIAPTTNVVGMYAGSLDDCGCFGHDGNHYALVLNNELEVTTTNFRWSGGGGILTICQASLGFNTGNNVHIHPYGVLSATGTAHGYAHSSAVSSGSSGLLNFITYVRPQVNITGAAGATGTQKLYTDAIGVGKPQYVTVIGADFEASGFANGLDYGPSTVFLGNTYVATTSTSNMINSLNTSLGFNALALAGANSTTQQKSVAIGQSTLAALTTSTASVAVGYFALAAATGAQNTAVGYTAGQAVVGAAGTTFVGTSAGKAGAGTASNSTVTSNYGTAVGFQSGPGSTGDPGAYVALGKNATVGSGTSGTAIGTNGIAIGAGASAGFNGSVAIGTDHNSTAATAPAQDVIALGTANHQVQLLNNTTGAGSALLAANCPAVTPAAPYTWIRMMSSDGSTVYVPAWK